MINFFKSGTETFEDIKDNFEVLDNQDSNKLVQALFYYDVYISLIFIDFTYLNHFFGDYEKGNKLKAKVLNFLDSRKEILHYTLVSSKIFIFCEQENFKELKIGLNSVEEEFKKNYKIDRRRIIFFIDKFEETNEKFKIFKLDENQWLDSLNQIMNIEMKLNSQRKFWNDYFDKIDSSKSKKDVDNAFSRYYVMFRNDDLKVDEKIINSIDEVNKSFILNLLNNPQYNSSFYLRNIFNLFLKSFDEQNFNYYLNLVKQNIIKYFIWFQMQKFLLYAVKIEKIKTFFDNDRNSNMKNNDVVKIDSQDAKNLINWFNSTIKIYDLPNIDFKLRQHINWVREKIRVYLLNPKDKDLAVDLKVAVNNFVKLLNFKGMYNIPFDKIRPSENALNYFKEYLYLHFGTGNYVEHNHRRGYKEAFEKWLYSSLSKNGYYIFVKEPENLYESHIFFKNLNKDDKNVYLHSAFLEIDGFNAFNTFYFPNDGDDIIYKKILDKMFEITHRYLKEHQKLFSNLLISALGDEFFFTFITNKRLGYLSKYKNIIKKYLAEIQYEILEICKDIKFPKTSKVKIETSQGTVTFRKLLFRSSKKLNEFESYLDIGSLGISGLYNFNHRFSNKEEFFSAIQSLEAQMDLIKKDGSLESKNKGKIKELKI